MEMGKGTKVFAQLSAPPLTVLFCTLLITQHNYARRVLSGVTARTPPPGML